MVIAPSQKEIFFMNRAIELAQKARLLAPPNPWVGCVIIKHGEIIGEGWTQPFGGAHAEAMALSSLKEDPFGSTMYVTLEPCQIQGKVAPCTQAIIKAGIKKVVIGIEDPDHKVKGQGIAALKQAGIEVEKGLLEKEIRAQLEPYIYHRETGRPFCLLKAAISMDGKIAAKNGSSIWITGELARENVHRIRAESQAILIGTNTAIEDQPSLTVRSAAFKVEKQPLRVVLDAKGRIEPVGPLFDTSLAPTLILTSNQVSEKRIEEWKEKGCEVQVLPLNASKEGLDLKKALQFLGQRGVVQLLIEGGSQLYSSLINEKLVNRLVFYMGACLLGAEGVSLFSKLNLESIDDAIRMHMQQLTRLGKDIRIDYTF